MTVGDGPFPFRSDDAPMREPRAARPTTTIEVLGTERMARAVRVLFRDGYDTVEIAALVGRTEPEIVELLHPSLRIGGR